jgi:predicted phage baseplate assembly protein
LFHETVSPQLTLKAAMQEDLTVNEGQTLLFFGTDAQAQNLRGRRVFFQMTAGPPVTAGVTSVETETSPALASKSRVRLLTFDKTFTYADFPNLNPTVIVYGNLVDATQGKTESQVALGNGDSRQIFQLFKLPKSPLTYLLSLGQTPPEVPELQIWVSDRLWKRVPTLFGHKYDEEIYIVREDANNESWVQFGDGQTGARLPSGIKNVQAKFRTGTGAFGELKPDTKVQAGARLEKLVKVQMPGVAAGGSEPESGENARAAAPGKIQSLDRLVSLKDFESEVLAISGVSVATASWELEDNIALLFVTVLMETGREKELDDVRAVIAGYNVCRGPNRFHVRVREGRLQFVALDVVYGLDPTYQEIQVTAAIKNTLGALTRQSTGSTPTDVLSAETDPTRGLFGIHNRHFAEPEYRTRIVAAVQNVTGVVWARVTAFMSLGEAVDSSNEPIDPASIPQPLTKTLQEKIVCDGLHILALHEQHLVVSPAAEVNTGVCS